MSAPDGVSISVVVPTYNDVAHVGQALESILAQTLAPGEILVVDDGSEDGTEQLVQDLAERRAGAGAPPIRYVRQPARSGVVAARNAGISQARGDWIATCDSDDTWAPTKLERQVEFFRRWSGRRRLVLLGTYGYNTNEAGKVISVASIGPTSEEDYERLRATGRRVIVMHSSVMYARDDYLAVGGYTTDYGAADDGDFFRKMAELGVVLSLPEPLFYYRKRAGSVQLASFWDKRKGALHLSENERRRAAGAPPVTREQFDAQLAAAPPLARVQYRRRAFGAYYYRAGAMNIVNDRRAHGALQLALAALMSPALVRAGVRNFLRTRRVRA
jgi:glycosyltransferase involved in cell wall biosynthesis